MKLIMVYNADAGFLNGMMDSMHKLFSPATYQCSLCAITHDSFGMRKEWKEFIERINIPIEFFHRPDFRAKYPDIEVELPVILADENGEVKTILNASEMKAAGDVQGLINALSAKLEASRT
jgi:hypothetical protein